eukprot:gb/GECG01009498.1/.p1 GENE.gb/GECG01009498.1/~~gb/GECG01009498.1/.p1  ORF type:complete len:240 (+),score=38.77 gb/GECG01009498.1/:1-720(+)
MPAYVALQCGACNTFQAVQEPKQNKRNAPKKGIRAPQWTCKLCNKKQSITRVYASADMGKEIRPIVQNLNARRGEKEQLANFSSARDCAGNSNSTPEEEGNQQHVGTDWNEPLSDDQLLQALTSGTETAAKTSEWDEFVEESNDAEDSKRTENDSEDSAEGEPSFVTSSDLIQDQRKKKRERFENQPREVRNKRKRDCGKNLEESELAEEGELLGESPSNSVTIAGSQTTPRSMWDDFL